MGYTTDFSGAFYLDKPLKPEHEKYLTAFSNMKHMARNAIETEKIPDPIRIAAKLPIGDQGQYFVGSANKNFGQNITSDVIENGSRTPVGMPEYWCLWTPGFDGDPDFGADGCKPEANCICWNEGEKFYNYEEWIVYVIKHFLKPWNYIVDGEVEWYGEDRNDIGKIVINNNIVKIKEGSIIYG